MRIQGLSRQQPGLLQIGLSDKQWGSFKLPFDMGYFGMTGCTQYIDAVIQAVLRSTSNGGLQLQGRLPKDKNLVGTSIFLQYISVDLGANAANLVNTNAVEISIGG